MFPCDQCGECCRNLKLYALYADLDRGDGVCRYLSGNLCSVYEDRPLLCRVDECYERFFREEMDRQQYYDLNRTVCEQLQQKARNKQCHFP